MYGKKAYLCIADSNVKLDKLRVNQIKIERKSNELIESVMSTLSKDRIDVRISKEQKEFVKYASELRGFKNLSEFVVYCINSEATKIVKENNLIVKTIEDKKIFLNAVLNAPAPNEELKRAQINYQKFKETNEFSNRGTKK